MGFLSVIGNVCTLNLVESTFLGFLTHWFYLKFSQNCLISVISKPSLSSAHWLNGINIMQATCSNMDAKYMQQVCMLLWLYTTNCALIGQLHYFVARNNIFAEQPFWLTFTFYALHLPSASL